MSSSTLDRSKLVVVGALAVMFLAAFVKGQTRSTDPSARIRLGVRLFRDARFSSPQGDLQNSCASCHLLDEDPQGMRAHTDFFSRSWVPWRSGDPRREELRNSPTILDAALMPRLHFDGEFASLEDLVKGTLAGRPMGWLPGEQSQAFDRVRDIIIKDAGDAANRTASYRADFKAAFDVDPADISKGEVIERVATAIADYMRTQKSSRTTPFDQFIKANGLDAAPAANEESKQYGGRLLTAIAALERKRALKTPAGFDTTALKGLKIFFRTEGASSVGNCVACHAPPLFTDFSFHNMGISQSEYDQFNGEGSFAELKIPSAHEARRPSTQFREQPSKQKPGCADLGFWNFVDLKSSTMRRSDETDDQFLERMIGTFKTPTLRNLTYTSPYMHTGGFSSLESALEEVMRLSELSRAGRVREADDDLKKIKLREADIPAVVAFLNTLNEDLKPLKKY
jgi:cytochrome c peroxidase